MVLQQDLWIYLIQLALGGGGRNASHVISDNLLTRLVGISDTLSL